MNFRCVFYVGAVETSVLLCVVLICKVGIVVMGRFCLNMRVVGDIYELGQGTTGCSEMCSFGGCSEMCSFGVMYGEWYGVCDFSVLSVVEVCVEYGGVNVFHICFDFCVFYGVGFFVNVCGVFCIVYCLFLTSGCCLLCHDVVWGIVIVVLSVMRVVGGVSLWVVCVCFVV